MHEYKFIAFIENADDLDEYAETQYLDPSS